ncbi:MAG: LysR family transcriptional regulator [Arenicella sp.]|nr:LysR family transcriptional regulator [Arenicella sp.]
MNWNNLKYFIATAEAGSMTQAARRLGVSAATIGRHIDKLQDELGVSLMRRGRNGVSLSEAGVLLAKSANSIASQLYDLERQASVLSHGSQMSPIRISATEPIISEMLAPNLPSLFSENPHLRIEFLSSTNVANLDHQEADLAIRLFKPEGDTLIAKRLPDIQMACFTSNAYINNRDIEAIELVQEKLLVFSEVYGKIAEVKWVNEQSLNNSVALCSSSSRALLEAAKNGLGIAIVARFLGERHGLIEVPAKRIPNRQAWLISHRETKAQADIRLVKRWIVSTFKATLA